MCHTIDPRRRYILPNNHNYIFSLTLAYLYIQLPFENKQLDQFSITPMTGVQKGSASTLLEENSAHITSDQGGDTITDDKP
jgi:hypothetical protein